jgi:hypothetical protein
MKIQIKPDAATFWISGAERQAAPQTSASSRSLRNGKHFSLFAPGWVSELAGLPDQQFNCSPSPILGN